MNCFNCNEFAYPQIIHSKISLVPEGLDRGEDVQIALNECKICGCITINNLDNKTHNLYIDDSTCFEASQQTVVNNIYSYPYSSNLFSRKTIEKLERGRICDFGCGAGFATKILSDINPNTFGIDVDKESVKFATKNGLDVIYGDINTLKKSSFDHFISIGVLEHFQKPKELLNLVTDKIRSNGGIIYLAFPNINAITFKLSKFSKEPWDMLCEPGHYSLYSKTAIVNYFQDKKFKLNSMRTTSHIGRGKNFLATFRSAENEKKRMNKLVSSSLRRKIYKIIPQILDKLKIGDIVIFEFEKI